MHRRRIERMLFLCAITFALLGGCASIRGALDRSESFHNEKVRPLYQKTIKQVEIKGTVMTYSQKLGRRATITVELSTDEILTFEEKRAWLDRPQPGDCVLVWITETNDPIHWTTRSFKRVTREPLNDRPLKFCEK